MNSKQITACVGAGVLTFGVLWMVARRNFTPVDPNDSSLMVSRTVTLGGEAPNQGAVDSAALIKKAGRDATNLFRVPAGSTLANTNEHFQGAKVPDEGLIQPEALGLLPGALPGN